LRPSIAMVFGWSWLSRSAVDRRFRRDLPFPDRSTYKALNLDL
jgi:hypothetical protein